MRCVHAHHIHACQKELADEVLVTSQITDRSDNFCLFHSFYLFIARPRACSPNNKYGFRHSATKLRKTFNSSTTSHQEFLRNRLLMASFFNSGDNPTGQTGLSLELYGVGANLAHRLLFTGKHRSKVAEIFDDEHSLVGTQLVGRGVLLAVAYSREVNSDDADVLVEQGMD